MCELHLTVGIMSRTAVFKTLCVKGGTHPIFLSLVPMMDSTASALLKVSWRTVERASIMASVISLTYRSVEAVAIIRSSPDFSVS